MKKTSTLFYLYENIDNTNFDEEETEYFRFDKFSDVLSNLNIKSESPSKKAIEVILEFAKTYTQEF